MTCRTVAAQLTAYLDGELDGDRASAVRGHLRLCAACRAVAEDHAAIRDRLGDLARPEPPAALWPGVLAQLGDAEIALARRSPWARLVARVRPHLLPAGLAVTACAAAVLVMQLHDGTTPTAPAAVAHEVARPGPDAGVPAAVTPRAPVRDASAELADEAARIDERFRTATAALLPLARAEIEGAARVRFDREVAALEARVVRAAAGKARDQAWHALLGFLERSALGAGRLALAEGRR
jgi:anti-sigma factor RsiW